MVNCDRIIQTQNRQERKGNDHVINQKYRTKHTLTWLRIRIDYRYTIVVMMSWRT
jgi:hypothetical protein